MSFLARREVVELDNSSDEEDAPVRLRRARRNKGKGKKASTSREDVDQKLRAFEARLKEAARTFYEVGEELRELRESL